MAEPERIVPQNFPIFALLKYFIRNLRVLYFPYKNGIACDHFTENAKYGCTLLLFSSQNKLFEYAPPASNVSALRRCSEERFHSI